jgi:hypothetical protein
MIAALGLTGRLFTLGAMHAQKHSRQPWPPVTICWFNLRTIRPICSMPPMPSPRAPSQPTPPFQLPSAVSANEDRSRIRNNPGIPARAPPMGALAPPIQLKTFK